MGQGEKMSWLYLYHWRWPWGSCGLHLYGLFCFKKKASCSEGEGSSCTHSLLNLRGLRRRQQERVMPNSKECFLKVGIADHRICVKRGARDHPSQWTSHLATDQNCLLKMTDSWCPSENNYIHISEGRPWESLCTLAARTLGPESNCLHQTLDSPPQANPVSAWTWGEAAHFTHPKRLILLLFLQLFQVLDWDRPVFKSCYTLHLWLCEK